jgi:hypothetical protein
MTSGNTGSMSTLSHSAEALNQDCFCKTLNTQRLRDQLENHPDLHGLMENITQSRPNLFSSTVVFISSAVQSQISACIAAIERVATLPDYQTQALARVDSVAQKSTATLGVCMGYDFHLSASGPQLIEINTNAGGLLLNAALAQAQEACCDAWRWTLPANSQREVLEQAVFDMFANEWCLQRGSQKWSTLVIVDDAPQNQYLAPEFELFRQLFARHGIQTHIADPSELHWQQGKLQHQGSVVDMVYNRLTDFYLSEPNHLSIRQAYAADAVVLTPHPRVHALLADKRNLIALSQSDLLQSWGASVADCQLLTQHIPTTHLVSAENAAELWAQRRQLFFKPVAGYGAKATYRGDKLTKKVWGEILNSDFVAQALVQPGARMIQVDGVQTDLKFDLRAFSYAGQVQLLAARIYAGQTTNFRTQGGGFAPVIVVPSTEQR